MSITDCKTAFSEAFGDAGALANATMGYEDGGKQQRLTFTVTKPDGTTEIITDVIAASVNPVAHSAAMARDYLTKFPGSKPEAETIDMAVLREEKAGSGPVAFQVISAQ
jgi:hypothetical protein